MRATLREKSLLAQQRIHSLQQRASYLRLGDVALYADFLGFLDQLITFMHGQNQDRHVRQKFS